MQAVILAAGMGKRLGKLTEHNTKCMVEVNGVTLIERTLSLLSSFELNRIVIVVGFQGYKVKQLIGNVYNKTKIVYIDNELFEKTNNIYSLYLAKKELEEDDTILLESDLIFERAVLEKVVYSKFPNIALLAKYEGWMDGTVALVDDNKILSFIPKVSFKYEDVDSYYKTVNIYKFSKEFSISFYIPFLEAYMKSFGNNEYYEQVLRVLTMLDHSDLSALILSGEKWYEIDDIQDLDIASMLFADSQDKLLKYQQRFGGFWRFPSLLDFCYLVNPYFPPKKLNDELKASFEVLVGQYPSGLNANILLASKCFGINPKFLCVGNGAAELINVLVNNITGNIGVIYPTFEEYPNRKNKEQIVSYIPTNNQFSYTATDLISYYSEKDISALILINPDNPSGNLIQFVDLKLLLEWTSRENILLILDESFIDFSVHSHENSLLKDSYLSQYNNLVVLKSISKSYGIPGLRLGILATGNKTILDCVKSGVSIWNINSFGEYFMQIFNKYEQEYKNACLSLINERSRFYHELSTITYLRIIPSQANYFLCEVISTYKASDLSLLLLECSNILIKDCTNKKGFESKECIRIAIKNQKENEQLVSALKLLEKNVE